MIVYKDRIIEWYGLGNSATWIAKKVGFTYATIVRWLRSWDVEIRPSNSGGKPTEWTAARLDAQRQGVKRRSQDPTWVKANRLAQDRRWARYRKEKAATA